MNAFLQHFSFELRTGVRNKALLFLSYIFPLLVYGLLGMLMTSVLPDFRETMIPAMVIFGVLSGAMLGMPDPIMTARKAGIYRSYRINGVPASSVLLIPALSNSLHLLVVSAIITFTSPPFFDAPLPTNWLAFLLVFLTMLFAFVGISLLIGVIATNAQMTLFLSQAVFLPSMLLGGLMMPASFLPPTLARIALILPTSHAMNAFLDLSLGRTVAISGWWSLLVLAAGGLLAFVLALVLFTWDPDDPRLRRRAPLGLIALLPYVLAMILF